MLPTLGVLYDRMLTKRHDLIAGGMCMMNNLASEKENLH